MITPKQEVAMLHTPSHHHAVMTVHLVWVLTDFISRPYSSSVTRELRISFDIVFSDSNSNKIWLLPGDALPSRYSPPFAQKGLLAAPIYTHSKRKNEVSLSAWRLIFPPLILLSPYHITEKFSCRRQTFISVESIQTSTLAKPPA